jgi:hypothetical protein
MKNTFLLFYITLLFPFTSIGQVVIGNTNPNTNTLLEIEDGTDSGGVLLPRATLSATTISSPLATDIAGMIVYNTVTDGDVTPGFYYNDGALWIRLGAGTTNGDWSSTWNSSTIAGTNFLGTTDGVDFVLATNGSENMRLINGGQITVNTSTHFSVNLFTV